MKIKQRDIFQLISRYYDNPEAVIITGMRRTGKTTVLTYVYEQIDSENKLFIDLENPLNRKYFEETNYDQIRSVLSGLGLDFSKRMYIFIDEIQFVKQLPSVVKYFIDHYKTKFFLTGSASFYLKNYFTETLAGRKYIFNLYPLSFCEFLTFKQIDIQIPPKGETVPRPLHDTISPYFNEYLEYGGFPGVVLKETKDEKERSLNDIFTSYYHLEVTELGDFRKNEKIRELIILLMQRAGSRLNYQKLSKELGISRQILDKYVSFLCDTFFIHRIAPFSKGRDTEIRKSPKIYVCDTGLLHHFSQLDMGHIFENGVFQSLLPQGKVNYYQRKSGVEIDFIIDQKNAYEVKIHPSESDHRKLSRLAEDLGISEYYVVSKKYCDSENTLYGYQL